MSTSSTDLQFSFANGTVLIGDFGVSGGQLSVFCCAREIAIEQTADEEEIICDPVEGPVARIFTNPRLTITLEEANFDEAPISNAFGMIRSINTYGYDIMGNGSDPNTTPTALTQVDGPHVIVYVGNEGDVQLNNGLIIEDSVVAWERQSDGSFTNVVITAAYAHASTNLATGEVHYTDALDTSPIYFTYKYNPCTPGSVELGNPWNVVQEGYKYIKILHEHTNGELWIFEAWKCLPRPETSLTLKTLSGDKVVTVPLVFTAFSDARYHPTAPIARFRIDAISRTITPDYGCDGANYATAIA